MRSIAEEIRRSIRPNGQPLTEDDVGRELNPGSGFGRVLERDVGKRVWLRSHGLVMENDAQRDVRQAAAAQVRAQDAERRALRDRQAPYLDTEDLPPVPREIEPVTRGNGPLQVALRRLRHAAKYGDAERMAMHAFVACAEGGRWSEAKLAIDTGEADRQ